MSEAVSVVTVLEVLVVMIFISPERGSLRALAIGSSNRITTHHEEQQAAKAGKVPKPGKPEKPAKSELQTKLAQLAPHLAA